MMMQIVFFWLFWNNFTAGDCLINLDQSPTCCLVVTGKERDRQLMVQCESAVTILTKWTQWSPWRQNLFFDGPSNWFTNLRCFQQSHIYRSVLRFFYFPLPKRKKKRKELVWLCFGFLCAVASFDPQVWLGLSVEALWFLWEKVCQRECGSCPWDNTGLIQHNGGVLKKIFFWMLPEKIISVFSSCKKSPFLSLSYFVTNQVFRCREACLSLPPSCLQPVFNSLLCCWFHPMITVFMLCWKTLFSHASFKWFETKVLFLLSFWCQSIYYQIVWF